MSKVTNKQLVEILQKISEAMDNASINDAIAWNHIYTELEKLVGNINDKKPDLSEILNLCMKGIKIISEKSSKNSLSVVDAIFNAFSAAELRILNKSGSKDSVSKASKALKNIVGNSTLSLNDVASMLIQLDSSNVAELAKLKQSFEAISVDESYPELSREKIVLAMEKLKGILDKNIAEPDLAFDEVGELMEEAMNAIDQPQRVEEPKQKKEISMPVESTPVETAEKQNQQEEPDDTNYMPSDPDTELIGEFVMEGGDLITNAEEALLSLEDDPDDVEAIGTVFRAFHTIKGTAAFMELSIVAEMAHHAESLLSRVREKEIRYTGGYADLALRSLDMLKDLIELVQEALGGAPLLKPDGYNELMRVLENPEASGVSEESSGTSEAEPQAKSIVKDEPVAQPSETEVEDEEPDDTNYMPSDPDTELIGEFVMEGGDLITNAEEALLSLEDDPDDMEAIGTVFRAFHTIKGTAAFMELAIVAEMAHHAESLLSRVRDKEIRYTGGYADLALRSLDMLKDLIGLVQEALGGAPLLKPDGYNELMRVLENPEASGVSEKPAVVETETTTPKLGEILVAQGDISKKDMENIAASQGDKHIGVAIVKSKAASVKKVVKAIRTQQKMQQAAKSAVQPSVRVQTERLDQLIDMVGELVVAQSMVSMDETIVGSNDHDLLKKVGHASKIVRELQDLGMSMRMIPLKGTFQKMNRLVRDLSRKMGKNVNFITEGEDTEIDRNMVDIIKDPLVHMVRNAVDHGIEVPAVREQAQKPKFGTVQLSAYHSAGSVVVEIKEDGKGLAKDMILAKALEKGLIDDIAAAQDTLRDRDIYNMIFEPGFSTAKEVTDVSGRGVGMDVVRKNIEVLRGQVEIQSKEGHGSVFKMRLPLTLAIIDGMVVTVGKETYVIPTVSIVRSIKPEPKYLTTVLNKGEMLSLQGKLIPLFRLASFFHVKGAKQELTEALVIIIEDDGMQVGLVIDELIGRQQVVIKTLGETMKNIVGISGGAIMPNGRVGLIIDVGGLIKATDAGSMEVESN